MMLHLLRAPMMRERMKFLYPRHHLFIYFQTFLGAWCFTHSAHRWCV